MHIDFDIYNIFIRERTEVITSYFEEIIKNGFHLNSIFITIKRMPPLFTL